MPGAPFILENQERPPVAQIAEVKKKWFLLGGILFLAPLISFVFYFQKPADCIALPNALPEFVGRKEMINEIKKRLFQQKGSVIPVVVLWGEGGIGKTETAIYFANESIKKFSSIYWINAGSREVYVQSYLNLAEHFGIGVSNQIPFPIIRDKVHDFLEKRKGLKPWLIIYDNVDEVIPLPQKGKGKVLITARNKILIDSENALHMPFFKIQEAKELYKKFVNRDEDQEWVTLVEQLDFYPLAINQAFHLIKDSATFSVKDYIQWISKNQKAILTVDLSLNRYPQTLSMVWEKAKRMIQDANPRAYEWLEICSSLHPDQIPLHWVELWLMETYSLNSEEAKFEGQRILTILSNQGHIHINSKSNVLTIHRLKQLVIRLIDERSDEIAKKGIAFLISRMKGLESVDRVKNLVGDRTFLLQLEANAAWWLKKAKPVHSTQFEEVYLLNLLANIKAFALGKYEEALTDYQTALKILTEIITLPSSVHTLAFQSGGQAELLDNQLVRDKAKVQILLNKGSCSWWLNDCSMCEESLREALAIIEQYPREQMIDLYVFCLRSFGEVANLRGEDQSCIDWLEKSRLAYVNYYGEKKDLVLADLYKWLGIIYTHCSPEKGFSFLMKSLEIYHGLSGTKETYLKLSIVYGIGCALGCLSECSLGIKILKHGLIEYKKLFPYNYVEECVILGRIAELYFNGGDYVKSLNSLHKIGRIKKKYNIAAHRSDFFADLITGWSYVGLNKPEKGLEYLTRGYEKDRLVTNSKTSCRSFRFYLAFGDAYYALGQVEKAISEYEKFLASTYTSNSYFLHLVLTKLSKAWEKLDVDKAVYYKEWAKEVEKKKPKVSAEQKQALMRMI